MYDYRSFVVEPVIDEDNNNDNTLHHISRKTNTCKHTQHRHIAFPLNTSPSPAQTQAHLIPSGTKLAQEYLDNS